MARFKYQYDETGKSFKQVRDISMKSTSLAPGHKKQIIISTLLAGGNITNLRLRDAKQNPILRLTRSQFEDFRKVVKLNRKGWFVISRQDVRRQHGKSFIKQVYKQIQNERRAIQKEAMFRI